MHSHSHSYYAYKYTHKLSRHHSHLSAINTHTTSIYSVYTDQNIKLIFQVTNLLSNQCIFGLLALHVFQ